MEVDGLGPQNTSPTEAEAPPLLLVFGILSYLAVYNPSILWSSTLRRRALHFRPRLDAVRSEFYSLLLQPLYTFQ